MVENGDTAIASSVEDRIHADSPTSIFEKEASSIQYKFSENRFHPSLSGSPESLAEAANEVSKEFTKLVTVMESVSTTSQAHLPSFSFLELDISHRKHSFKLHPAHYACYVKARTKILPTV